MATKVKFYTIGIETNEGELTDISVNDLLNKLDELRLKNIIKPQIEVFEKVMKYYKFSRMAIGGNDKYIIPFGTLKKNKPYEEDGSGDITPYEKNLFDISFMYYDDNEKVALITCDQSCPKSQAIEVYLNALFNMRDYRFVIKPILKETDLKRIQRSKQVKSLIITLNLHDNVNEVFNDKIQNDSKSFGRELIDFVYKSMNNYNSKKISFEMSLGMNKSDSLDIEKIMDLLSTLDMDSSAIDKIDVRYKDSHTEKIDVAKLKNRSFEMEYDFGIPDRSLGKDYLLNNAQSAIDKTRYEISPVIREYCSSSNGETAAYELKVNSCYIIKQPLEV